MCRSRKSKGGGRVENEWRQGFPSVFLQLETDNGYSLFSTEVLHLLDSKVGHLRDLSNYEHKSNMKHSGRTITKNVFRDFEYFTFGCHF